MTATLVFCFLALQAAFIWARYAIFRIDGRTPPAVRLIEASATICIVFGLVLTLRRAESALAWERLLDALALLMAAASAVMFAWAVRSIRPRQLTAAFSADAPVELLRGGAFSFVRNPFYLAYMLAFAMPLVASRSAWGLVPAVWMAGIYLRAVKAEERKFLAGPLADDFRRYAERTGRFLPRLHRQAHITGGASHGR